MLKWLTSLGMFSIVITLHWVAGNEFERGKEMAATLVLALVLAGITFAFNKIAELEE